MFLCFWAVVLAAAVVPAMGQASKAPSKAGGVGQTASAPATSASMVAPSTAGLKCTGSDSASACTAAQVADLNHGILVGRRVHQTLAMVQGVSQGSNGQLKCTQTNGSACTDAQLSAVIGVAGESQTGSAGVEFHVTRSIDRASP
jgi:hypothetical protein